MAKFELTAQQIELLLPTWRADLASTEQRYTELNAEMGTIEKRYAELKKIIADAEGHEDTPDLNGHQAQPLDEEQRKRRPYTHKFKGIKDTVALVLSQAKEPLTAYEIGQLVLKAQGAKKPRKERIATITKSISPALTRVYQEGKVNRDPNKEGVMRYSLKNKAERNLFNQH